MRRNNEDRLLKGHTPASTEDAPQMANPMDFVTPTQFVSLPSKGRYPEGHPLSGKDSIEIKYMTAKDEDILTNRSLLKKGLAIDRLISNVIKDNSVDSRSLLIGDRNAILIYARASAYGEDYKTKVKCPNCETVSKFTFDLSDHETFHGDDLEKLNMTDNGDGTFMLNLPVSKITARIRPMVVMDEIQIAAKDKSKKSEEEMVTQQMKRFVVSFNGYEDQSTLNYVVDNMIAKESKMLRDAFKSISPDVVLEQSFTCRHCDHEEVMTVPFGTDFFWPDS
jgi:phage FluMu protein Com